MAATSGKALRRAVAAAADAVFAHPRLAGFARLDAGGGHWIRRYYRRRGDDEHEIAIYAGKHWGAGGGLVYAELFFLGADVQRALGGGEQSWLDPDYARPLAVLQYRTAREAVNTEWRIASGDDVETFAAALGAFLPGEAHDWFAALSTPDGVVAWLERQARHLSLACLHAHLGNRDAALAALRDYLRDRPRQIEDDLARLVACGLISAADGDELQRASLQHEEEYARRVAAWLGQ